MKVGNYPDAVTDCNWAIFLRPQDGEAYYLRALANISGKDFYAACEDVQNARQLGFKAARWLANEYCGTAGPTARK
jgi:hypothetical protein